MEEQEIEYLDEKFPKGKSKLRGEAMVLLALTKQETKSKILQLQDKFVEDVIQEVRLKAKCVGEGTYSNPITMQYLETKDITEIVLKGLEELKAKVEK